MVTISLATLETIRQAAAACAERAALLAAVTAYRAASDADRHRTWFAAYSDAQPGGSPALAFRKAVRELVLLNAPSASAADRECAYRLLAAEADRPMRPPTETERVQAIRDLAALATVG